MTDDVVRASVILVFIPKFKMANVRDSDTSLWLHNKLGTSNDSWTSGSICSQLNKEVLRNIKDCFPELQTQVKLKLLLSFFHIPRRLVEEWKTELEEIIEIAGLDSELWVSMIAETIKTFPNTGSLNTEISDYEETRPIFTDMVNDLKKLINKHSDIGMLPLECQYLNKAALISVVGQQPPAVKHFTIKKKPKSAALKAELMQKCSDVQSIKKTSAPTIPLRSRGMPRKMTDTTPLKGIPSRFPFRSPTSSQGPNRPNMSRTPAGRKDGGIKLLDITEQPLGYAAAKKRKRQQELEDQQKRALESQATPVIKVETPTTPTTTTPLYAAGLNATSIVYTQPATPLPTVIKEQTVVTSTVTPSVLSEEMTVVAPPSPSPPPPPLQLQPTGAEIGSTIQFIKSENIKSELITIKSGEIIKTETISTPIFSTNQLQQIKQQPQSIQTNTFTNLNNNNNQMIFSIKSSNSAATTLNTTTTSPTIIRKVVNSIKQESPRIIQQQQSAVPTIISTQQPTLIKSIPSSTKIVSTHSYMTPASVLSSYNPNSAAASTITTTNTKPKINIQSVISTVPPGGVAGLMPSLTALSQAPSIQQQQQQQHHILPPQQQHQQEIQIPHQIGATKIVQIKTAPTIQMISSPNNNLQQSATTATQQRASIQNIPPLIPTQQPTILNIRNVSMAGRQAIANQIQTTNASNISYITSTNQPQQQQQQSQIQQQIVQQHQIIQQQQQQQPSTIQVSSAPKYSQVVMSPTVKGNTIILSNPNTQPQKTLLLRTIGADGKTTFQQVPISNLSGLNLSGNTNNMTIVTGPSGLMKTSLANNQQIQQHQIIQTTATPQHQQQQQQHIPALVPTSNYQTQQTMQPVIITSSNAHQQPQQQTLPQLITNLQQHNQQIQQQPQTIRIQQQPQQQGQTIIRPLMVTNSQGVSLLPQGLTLIQRPGQQPQIVQTIQPQQQQQTQQQPIHRTIIQQHPQQQQQQIRQVQIRQQPQPQQIIIQQQPKTLITQQKPQQQQQQQIQQLQQPQQQQQRPSQQPHRKGLTLSNDHANKAHEMFRRANCVTRPDKALILSFMAGCRENPMPNADNCIVIKLHDDDEKVKQSDDSFMVMRIQTFIKLDYNTGDWKQFSKISQSEQQQLRN